jgi:DNA-binding CsgD family transcriptional regulator
VSSDWQLLERPSEREAIRAALHADGRGVVVIGAAGVGKTTLTRVVTDSLVTQVHWAACTESSQSIPLGAFAQWVSQDSARDPIALLASARQALFAGGEAIVGVDDAHLLDQLSATLLHHIAVDGVGRIVATVRSGEPIPDAVTSLWKDGYLARLELRALDKVQSIALVESVLGGALEELSADALWDASGGNPLFLRYTVEGALEAGRLTAVNGVWQLRGDTAVHSGLAALLEARLDAAGAAAVAPLRLLALCEPLDVDTLIELVGEDALDAAEAAGLIRIVHDGPRLNARISHPLYGDVVRRRIGTASARRRRGEIAAVLQRQELDSPAKRIRLAQLQADSDQPVESAFMVSAAKDAVFLANLPLGERLARKAFERDGGIRAGELLSRALLWQGRPAEAEAILAQFDPDDLDELELVQWGIPRLSTLFWAMGAVGLARDLLELLRERVSHPALRLIVDATASAMVVHEGDLVAGLAAAQAVLADPDAPTQAVDFAAFAAGLAMGPAGRGDEFEPIGARCRVDQKPTDGLIRAMIRYGDVLSLVHSGQLAAAERRVAEYAEFTSTGQFTGWAITKITDGLVNTYRGRFPDAIRAIEQALAALNAESSLPWRLPARLLLARAYAALGQPEEAARVLAEAREHTGAQVAVHEPARLIAESWLTAARGGARPAAEEARKAAAAARRVGQYALEAEALHHAARFGDRTVAARLTELAKQVAGPVVGLAAEHAAAVAAHDAAALDELSTRFEAVGVLLSAADAAAQAAVLHEAAHRSVRAAESTTRARQLAVSCGQASTPALRAAVRPLPISEREREVALLIAQGLTSREIAEQLVVSTRTVEGHIYRACIKLDVSDRDELAALLRAHR